LVQIGQLYPIAAIGTIGQKSTFSMKNHFCFTRYLNQTHTLCVWYSFNQPEKM